MSRRRGNNSEPSQYDPYFEECTFFMPERFVVLKNSVPAWAPHTVQDNRQ